MPRTCATAEERFLAKVMPEPTSGCWLWLAAANRDGYGAFAPGDSRPPVLAHRWSFAHFVGPIPERQNVLHRCDTPCCVNPSHLFLGDQSANVLDAVRKNRWGHRGPFHKLSPEIHKEIRLLYQTGDFSQSALAAKFGVSQPTVSSIVRRAA